MAQKKSKRTIKVHDLQPKKDAKGGRQALNRQVNHNQFHNQSVNQSVNQSQSQG